MQIEIGKIQTLTVVKKVDFGVYLAPEGKEEKAEEKTSETADGKPEDSSDGEE